MNVKFLGAAKNVTGSKFLLEILGKKILVDCGLYQEREFLNRNWDDFPIDPKLIDSVVITHGHLDHCGYLPKLVKDGFKGDIFCTEPTVDIIKIILFDSAKIQEEDSFQKKIRHEREGRKPLYPEIPLYTVEDAQNVFSLLKGYPYKQKFELFPGVSVVFYDAGHILGSAIVEITVTDKGEEKKIVFSGDLGRKNKPILCDPEIIDGADILFIESTYGNKKHESEEEAGKELARIINRTVNEKGNIVVPVFALERAQEMLYFLSRFLKENIIPHIFVFVDSPMAINIIDVFKKYPQYFDENTKNLIKKGESPFYFSSLELTKTVGESKSINRINGSAIIMAGSGMCTGGRIKHHLISNITRKESSIVFVGYQARGTLGRQILENPKEIRILGNYYPIKSYIERVEGFSAHADRDDLIFWIKSFKKKPKKIFVVHGEEEVIEDFAVTLRKETESEVIVPEYLSEFNL